jgi:hypothetical protein
MLTQSRPSVKMLIEGSRLLARSAAEADCDLPQPELAHVFSTSKSQITSLAYADLSAWAGGSGSSRVASGLAREDAIPIQVHWAEP